MRKEAFTLDPTIVVHSLARTPPNSYSRGEGIFRIKTKKQRMKQRNFDDPEELHLSVMDAIGAIKIYQESHNRFRSIVRNGLAFMPVC